MTYHPPCEDEESYCEYTVEVVVKVKLKMTENPGLDEDDLSQKVVDQFEGNCPDVLDVDLQEIEITEVE